MNVAVCEDDREDMEVICGLLREYDQMGQFDVKRFASGGELLAAAETEDFDLAVMDIEMTRPNGFETARQLAGSDAPPLIIFATRSMEYTIQGYGVAFRYIPKPVTMEKLAPALDAAVREIRANRFTFAVDGRAYILRIQEIYYFEVYGHVTTVHTAAGSYSIRATLRDALAQLPQGYFGMPHQSYIVNLAHVRTATAQEVTLVNGAVIPVSRRRQMEFMAQLQSYLGR